jgi:hypothetical protein
MDTNSHLAYVQARVQTRHGQRLSPSQWQTLESSRDIASFLQGARSTHLRRWIEHLPADVNPHRIERSLRDDWKKYVSEIAAWVSAEWKPSIEWMGTLVDLQAIVHLLRGYPVPYWMREDPTYAPYAIDDRVQREELLRDSELGAAMATLDPEQKPLVLWLAYWRTLQPEVGAELRSRLDGFSDIVLRYMAIEIDPGVQPREGSRAALIRELERHFRLCSGTIGAVISHIGLMALCWERLRAGLLLRVLIPVASRRPQWA